MEPKLVVLNVKDLSDESLKDLVSEAQGILEKREYEREGAKRESDLNDLLALIRNSEQFSSLENYASLITNNTDYTAGVSINKKDSYVGLTISLEIYGYSVNRWHHSFYLGEELDVINSKLEESLVGLSLLLFKDKLDRAKSYGDIKPLLSVVNKLSHKHVDVDMGIAQVYIKPITDSLSAEIIIEVWDKSKKPEKVIKELPENDARLPKFQELSELSCITLETKTTRKDYSYRGIVSFENVVSCLQNVIKLCKGKELFI